MNSQIHQLRGILESSHNNDDNDRFQMPTSTDQDNPIVSEASNPATGPTPAFLSKLWQLVNDAETDYLVGWSSTGRSFIVYDQVQFSKQILPNYFKHQKMNSFVRQLNMYGFKKVPKLNEGTLHSNENDQIEFINDLFVKGSPESVARIKRKETKRALVPPRVRRQVDDEQLTALLQDLSDQQKQTHQDFDRLKEENSELWKQVGNLRKKHDKQQDTVQRLITFMIHFIQQSHNSGTSRPAIGNKRPNDGTPLMITDGKRLNIEEYMSPSSSNFSKQKNNTILPDSIHPPESPLSQALKRANIPMISTSEDQYFVNQATGTNVEGPVISEIPENEIYYDLEPTPNTSGGIKIKEEVPQTDSVSKIKRSMSRQNTTLSSIMGMLSPAMEGNDMNSYFDTDLSLDDFTAG